MGCLAPQYDLGGYLTVSVIPFTCLSVAIKYILAKHAPARLLGFIAMKFYLWRTVYGRFDNHVWYRAGPNLSQGMSVVSALTIGIVSNA